MKSMFIFGFGGFQHLCQHPVLYPDHNSRYHSSHTCEFYYTCAVDTHTIKKVLEGCRSVIIKKYLETWGIWWGQAGVGVWVMLRTTLWQGQSVCFGLGGWCWGYVMMKGGFVVFNDRMCCMLVILSQCWTTQTMLKQCWFFERVNVYVFSPFMILWKQLYTEHDG